MTWDCGNARQNLCIVVYEVDLISNRREISSSEVKYPFLKISTDGQFLQCGLAIPIGPFRFMHHIPCIAKDHPAFRIDDSANVIAMPMRENHRVDVVRRDVFGAEMLE